MFRSTPLVALVPLLAASLGFVLLTPAGAGPIETGIDRVLQGLDPAAIDTGILYDRVLPLAHLERFDGSDRATAADLATWRQAYDELRRSASAARLPELAVVMRDAKARRAEGVIPLALIDERYQRIRADALARGALRVESGRLVPGAGPAYVESTAFVLAPLADRTWRGSTVRFVLDRDRDFTNDASAPQRLELDLGDGNGFRAAAFGAPQVVHYATTGVKTLRVRLAHDGGATLVATSHFTVEALTSPTPNDTLHVTATVPYLGQSGTGDAYVDLAPGHAALVNPVVVIEGLDLDNSMNWDELYQLLNQQNLAENLRSQGFDLVVLNFTDATDYLERNAYVVSALIQQVETLVPPTTTLAVAGASMGAVCSRYALAWLETHGGGHRVRTWISFDGPQLGADIPLGIQYWIKFFSGQSADAATFLTELDRPAARELLVYHHTDPPGATGVPDPLRTSFLANLAAAGDWPALPRRVAIANGSGSQANQGFLPGDPIIRYEYSSFLVSVTGDVWAVPDLATQTIFNGRLRALFSNTSQTVSVSATAPYDGAPGGWRASMAQLDASSAPYGDIVALHPNHCFIPTISALALEVPDLFHDVAGDPSLLGHTRFDALYYPVENQEHVTITPQTAAWLTSEVERGLTLGVTPEAAKRSLELLPAAPNPFRVATRVSFSLPFAMPVEAGVYGVDGREVRALARQTFHAGDHELRWDGRNQRGRSVPAGVYFLRLAANGQALTQRLVRVR